MGMFPEATIAMCQEERAPCGGITAQARDWEVHAGQPAALIPGNR